MQKSMKFNISRTAGPLKTFDLSFCQERPLFGAGGVFNTTFYLNPKGNAKKIIFLYFRLILALNNEIILRKLEIILRNHQNTTPNNRKKQTQIYRKLNSTTRKSLC